MSTFRQKGQASNSYSTKVFSGRLHKCRPDAPIHRRRRWFLNNRWFLHNSEDNSYISRLHQSEQSLHQSPRAHSGYVQWKGQTTKAEPALIPPRTGYLKRPCCSVLCFYWRRWGGGGGFRWVHTAESSRREKSKRSVLVRDALPLSVCLTYTLLTRTYPSSYTLYTLYPPCIRVYRV